MRCPYAEDRVEEFGGLVRNLVYCNKYTKYPHPEDCSDCSRRLRNGIKI